MNHTQQKVTLALALFSPFTPAISADYEVYYWVDANGVANYSQMAPPDTTTGVSRQVLPDDSPADAGEDIFAVEATAKEMEALWKGIEDRRKESGENQSQPQQSIVVQQTQPEVYGFPVWYQRPGRGNANRPGYGRPGSGQGNGQGAGPDGGMGQGPNPLPPIMRPPPGSLLEPRD